jgi:hypothetical protein
VTWVRIDDRYPTHRKMLRAGPLAIALDVAGMCYCAGHATDGFIPTEALAAAAPFLNKRQAMAAAGQLVNVGRWVPVDGGWRIHDFLAYNPSAAERDDRRHGAVERTQRWRDRKRGRDTSTPKDVRRGGDTSTSQGRDAAPLGVRESSKSKLSLTPPVTDPSPDPTPAASPAGSSQAAADLAAEPQNNGQPPTKAQRAALDALLKRKQQDADAEEVNEP